MPDYIIPLRKEWLKVPIYKRTRYAVGCIRRFIAKHLKVDDVRIGQELNLELWKRGTRNPPHKVKVSSIVEEKEKERYAIVNLFGKPLRLKEEVKKEKEGILDKLKGAVVKKEEKPEEKKEDKARAAVKEKEDLLKMQDRKRQKRAFKKEKGKGELEMERETAIISKTYKKSS